MEAFAIKGPEGKIILRSIRANEISAWHQIGVASVQHYTSKNYTCVPVQVTEVEPKEPK